MLKGKKKLVLGLMVSIMSLTATPAFARSISMRDAGIAMWIFLIIGAIIILLQLIPAAILFFSFIGGTSSMVFKRKKAMEGLPAEEKEGITLPGYEPAPVKK